MNNYTLNDSNEQKQPSFDVHFSEQNGKKGKKVYFIQVYPPDGQKCHFRYLSPHGCC